MHLRKWSHHARLLCSAAAIALVAGSAQAAEAPFDIPAQPLSTALAQWGVQSDQGIFADATLTAAKVTGGVAGSLETRRAVAAPVRHRPVYRRQGDGFVLVGVAPAPSRQARGGRYALIVPAQKREEISRTCRSRLAFSQNLTTRQGPAVRT